MAKTTAKRIRLTDKVMALADSDYKENYAASGMSFTVYVNQKLFEILSGLTAFQQSQAAEGTGRPKTRQKTQRLDHTGSQNEDSDLDLNQIPDEI